MGPSKKENLVNIVRQQSIELQSFLNKFKLPDYDQRHRDYKKLFDLEKSIIAINFYNDLSVEKFKFLTDLNDLNFLNNVHENIKDLLEKLNDFKENYNRREGAQLDSLFTSLDTNSLKTIAQLKELNNILSSIYLNQNKSTLDTIQSEFTNKTNEIFEALDAKINNINDYEQRAKVSTENIEGLSVAAAGHKQTEFFQKSYNNYFWINFFWFLIIVFLIGFLIWGVLTFNDFYSFPLPSHLQNTEQNIQIKYAFYVFLASKISFAFVSLLAIYFCMKNFNANKHNAILNKHRADSLLTYKAILDVAGADKQDIILTQISDCMFKHQDTGFGKPDDSGPSWEQMLNIIAKAVGKSKEGG